MHGGALKRDILYIRNTKPNKHFNEVVVYLLITSESQKAKMDASAPSGAHL